MIQFTSIVKLYDLFIAIASTIKTWRLRHITSMEFTRVDIHTLHDLGISDARRFIEVNKPFWEK